MKKPPDYLQGNRDAWQKHAVDYVEPAECAWASDQPYWGIWRIPDSELNLLPGDMSSLRCIELGCGAGYVSAWMERRGAKVVAIDPTPNQLKTARRLRDHYGLTFHLEEGYAELVDYPDACFDFAISEYGAALWADPHLWVPEAARLLKPGGQLVFLSNSPLMVMCVPDHESDGPTTERLLRPYFDMHVTCWPDAPGQTEFHLNHGDWIALLRQHGFAIERLVELRAPENASTHYPWADAGWSRQWPSEEAWVVRKTA
jgi:SAM-dependent methyltransferase